MSPSSESTATSASNPEAIARAWAPEPLYDSSNRTSRPVSAFHCAAKAGRSAVVERLADDRVGADRQGVGRPRRRPQRRVQPGKSINAASTHGIRPDPIAIP